MKAVQTTRCDSEQHRTLHALATGAVVRQLSTDPKRGLELPKSVFAEVEV